MFDDKARVGLAQLARRLRRRLRRPRPATSTRRSRRCVPLLATWSRWRATWPTRDTQLDRFFRELGDAAAEAAPVAEQQAALFVNLDITFTALAAIARPFLQETISEGAAQPRRWRSGTSRCSARSCATTTALFRELRPGVATLPRGRRSWPTPSRPAPRCCPARRRSTRTSPTSSTRWPTSPRTRWCAQGIDQLTRLVVLAAADAAASSRPPRPSATTRRSGSATPPACSPTATRTAPGSASSSSRRREGPEQRGRAVVGARRTGPRRRTTSTPTPTRTRAAPGQTRECEAGNERYSTPARRHRQPAGQPGHRDQRAGADERRGRAQDARADGPLIAVQVGLIALVADRDPGLPRLLQGHPVHEPVRAEAVFENAPPIQKGTAVRIAGVDVGKVSNVEAVGERLAGRQGHDEARRRGASRSTRTPRSRCAPRIFLEGNLFLDVQPGHPARRESTAATRSRSPRPRRRSRSTRCSARSTPTRARTCRSCWSGYGEALNGEPQPGEDDDQDPDVQGETAGEALNDSLDYSADALRGGAIVNEAAARHRAARPLEADRAASRRSSARSSRSEGQLKDLDHQLQHHDGRARRRGGQPAARRSACCPRCSRPRNPALDNLNAAFPPTRAWALEMIPGVRETPATIEAGFPWIAPDPRAAVARPSCRGWWTTSSRRSTTSPQFVDGQVDAAAGARPVQPLPVRGVLPTRRARVIEDGALSTGLQNYQEFFQTLVGARRASRRTSTATAPTRASSRAAAATRCRPARSAHRRAALRQRHRAAAGHPPAPGGRSRPTSRNAPATAARART